jgi:hypothetical protein
MKFSEKISTILKTNTLGVKSPSKLEEYIKAGKGAITTPLRDNDAPGFKTEQKIVEKLRINQKWWDTGEGPIYVDEPQKDQVISLPLAVWNRLERNFDNFEKNSDLFEKLVEKDRNEKADLLAIVRHLTGTKVESHKMK